MSETVSTVCSFISLAMLFFAPIALIIYASSYRKNLDKKSKEDAEKYPTLSSANSEFFKDFKNDKYSQAYVVIFFIRRYFMILLLTLAPSSSNTQIFG